MDSKFVRFVDKKEYLLDDIINGFRLRAHDISFRPSIYSILPSMIDFWVDKKLSSKVIDPLVTNYKRMDEQNFWNWYVNEMKTNQDYNYQLSFVFAQINSAKIKMKCFTELRDNQKLHPNHSYWFGKYGISLTKNWMIRNHADRILYIDSNSEVTNRIARLIAMLLSTFDGKDVIKSMFDVLAFTEIEGNSHEYEWRIVGNNNFAGKSYGNYPDTIEFKTDDIESIFVEHDYEIEEFLKAIKLKNIKDGTNSIPQIYKSDSIFLTDKELKKINEIRTRK